jgi:hypothetical protein
MAQVTFAHNIVDASLNDASAALPGNNATTYSDEFDLGPGRHVADLELSCDLPLLNTTHMVNAGTTLTVSLISSDTPADQANGTEIPMSRRVITGTGSNIAAQSFRAKVPSDALRYVSFRFALAGAGSNASTAAATNVGPRF